MPPSTKWGYIALLMSVGRSVGRYNKPCPDDDLTQNRAWITKFGADIYLGMVMIPMDFQINPFKGKGHRVTLNLTLGRPKLVGMIT